MTTTSDLRNLSVAALTGKTNAGNNVFSPRDWPTWNGSYPVLMVQTPDEDMESLGRNVPQFTVTATLKVTARVQASAMANDGGAAQAEMQLEALRDQIKMALINNPSLIKQLQQFPFVRSQMTVNSEGEQHLGELVMNIGMEFYQGPEDFYPLEGSGSLPSVVTPLTETRINVDLVNIYDPNGTYVNPPFPSAVVPAPRESGPDGRNEGGLDINLPQ